MNPQQFGNMGAMGRGGMPGMMNNNQGMGMSMAGNNAMNGMPNVQQRQSGPDFLAIIYSNLQNSQLEDGAPQGWRATVTLRDRAAQIKILFDSLRVLAQSNDIRRSLDIALAFERKRWNESPSQEAYKQAIHEKLSSIRDQRQQMAQNGINSMQNSGLNTLVQNQGQNMQGLQMPNNVGQNLNFANGQPNMQQSPMMPQVQQQQSINPNQPMNAQMQLNQAQLNRARNLPELTKEDNMLINARAAEMAKSSRDQMSTIVQSMTPQMLQKLEEQNIDPIIYHFRMKATKEFRQMQAAKNNQNPMGMNINRMQTPNAAGQNMVQPNQTPYMGNIDQFTRQQAEAMQKQREGQLVVPVSNQNQNMSMDPARARQNMIVAQIRQQHPNATSQELRQLFIERMKQLQQAEQARQQATQMNAQMMMNQNQNNGNLVNQQNRGMNMLNQPLNPAGTDNPAQNMQMPQARPQPQGMGRGQTSLQQAQLQQSIQQIKNSMATLPPQVQSALTKHPESEWPRLIVEWRRRQAAQSQAQARAQQQAQLMQRTNSQQPQSMQQPNITQMPAAPVMQPTLSQGQDQSNTISNINQVQMQNQARIQQQLAMQNQQRLQQQQQQQQQQPPLSQQLTPNMQHQFIQETDPIVPHPSLCTAKVDPLFAQAGLQPLPPGLTWLQMKERVKGSPNGAMVLSGLREIQLFFAERRRQMLAGQKNAQAQQQLVAGASQQQTQPGLQAPTMGQQLSNMGTAAQQRPQITQQMIDNYKKTNPSFTNLTDFQVRDLIAQSAQKQSNLLNQAQNQVQALTAPAQQAQNIKVQNQARNLQQIPQHQQQQQPAGPSQNQNEMVVKQEVKNLKRPNQDDVPEGLNPQQSVLNQIPTKEQIAKMDPKERTRYFSILAFQRISRARKEVGEELAKVANSTIQMDQATRARMYKRLTDDNTKQIMERLDKMTMNFALNQPEKVLKAFIIQTMHLSRQYKDDSVQSKQYIPADAFTISPENLDKILQAIGNWFQQSMAKSNNAQKNAGQQAIPLTAENLDRAASQAAKESRAKPQKKDGPPPAPTVEKPPPFQFPGDRGQGTPKYASPGFKPEDLKLPPKKKQRNDAGASPISQPGSTQKPAFVCRYPGCQAPEGFMTEADLHKHHNDVHKPEMESAKDPVGFLNSSLQQAFNLDEGFEPKRPVSNAMQKTFSQGASSIGQGATPMGRVASQQKSTPSPSMRRAGKPQMPMAASMESAWDDTTFTLDDMSNIFGQPESGDVIPTISDSQEFQDNFLTAYRKTEDYKRVFGEPESQVTSEASSAKSKSPDQGSEPSLPGKNQTTAQNGPTNAQQGPMADPFTIDGNIDGNIALPALEGDFDDLWKNDSSWDMLENEGSMSPFEVVDAQQANTTTDLDFDSWINEPEKDNGTQEMEMMKWMEEPIDWDNLHNMDPATYAGGTLAWNATGKVGQDMRRQRGWPVEGAEGRAMRDAKKTAR